MLPRDSDTTNRGQGKTDNDRERRTFFDVHVTHGRETQKDDQLDQQRS